MDFKEMIKFQVMSQIGNRQTAQNGQGNDMLSNIWPMVLQFFLMACMGLFEDIMKTIPKFLLEVRCHIVNHFQKKMDKVIEQKPKLIADTAIPLSKRHFLNSLNMTRIYSSNDPKSSSSEESNRMVDAVLDQISKLNNVPSFQLIQNAQVMISYKDQPIQMNKDIYAKIDQVVYTDEKLERIKLSLLSNTITASDITLYVRGLYESYIEVLKNSIGDNIYFFDQKERDGNSQGQPPIGSGSANDALVNYKRMKISTAPKQLSFTMTPFYSNKQFSNIYGKEIRQIEQRVKFFIENKDWYDSKGIPYQLGLLLSGLPGAGKTSCIRAIANLTRRHIVNVNFANITTATQLKNLFYSDKIQAYTDPTMYETQSYFIPIEQRLYVLEEIDAIGDIVKQRKEDDTPKTTVNDELTLMEILTVLDGTMEIPGRIVIMTSNHPEVLDKALIRPGRIDLKVNFTYATKELIKEMYEAYFDKAFIGNTERLPEGVLSPAEVGQVLFRHFGTDTGIEEIIDDFVSTADEISRNRREHMAKVETSIQNIQLPSPVINEVQSEIKPQLPSPVINEVQSEIKPQLPSQVINDKLVQSEIKPQLPSQVINDKLVQSEIKPQFPPLDYKPDEPEAQLQRYVRNKVEMKESDISEIYEIIECKNIEPTTSHIGKSGFDKFDINQNDVLKLISNGLPMDIDKQITTLLTDEAKGIAINDNVLPHGAMLTTYFDNFATL
jgi:ATPase family associated with various cellular activities (AAA)